MVTMEQSMRNKVLDAYRTLARFVVFGARGQPPLWPFSIIETNWYYTKFLPKEIYNTIRKLENNGISKKKIAELCWGPSAISHWFYIIEPVFGDQNLNPFEGLTKEKGTKFIEKTVELLEIQRKGDPFCRDGKNIVLNENEVDNLLNFSFIKEKDIIKNIRLISMTLWHTTILIQAGHRAYSHEFHGPYQTEEGILFVKDFFNLRPGLDINRPVWKFTEHFPYDSLRIVEMYPSDTKIEVDMFNHFNINKLPIAATVIIDKEEIKKKERIKELFRKVQELANKGAEEIRNYTKADWVEKIIWLRYLWLKTHKDMLGMNWEPPEGIFILKEKTKEAEMVAKKFEENIISMVKGLKPDQLVEKIAEEFVKRIYGEGG